MAPLTSEAEEKYPLFETWLSRDFVHVVNNPRIMKAFWKWSHFTGPSYLRNLCFMPGMPPAIGLFDGCVYNPDGSPKGCH